MGDYCAEELGKFARYVSNANELYLSTYIIIL